MELIIQACQQPLPRIVIPARLVGVFGADVFSGSVEHHFGDDALGNLRRRCRIMIVEQDQQVIIFQPLLKSKHAQRAR